MTKQQQLNQIMYEALDDKEKIRRLEWIAKSFACGLDMPDWENIVVEACTQYWLGYQDSLEDYLDNKEDNAHAVH